MSEQNHHNTLIDGRSAAMEAQTSNSSSSRPVAEVGQSSTQTQQNSRLANLPAELLVHILEYLVPDLPELGDTKPVSYEKLTPGETWYEITRKQRGLRALCLTCRDLYHLAHPLLWRNVYLLDEEGMVLIYRSVTERPSLGNHAKFLSCHMTLTRTGIAREIKRAFTNYLPTFRPNGELFRSYPGLSMSLAIIRLLIGTMQFQPGDFDDVAQILLYMIFCLLPKLETVLLQAPVCDDHPEYLCLFDKLRVHADPIKPLQHVKNLLLQGDPELLMHFEGDDCGCDVPELWGVQGRRHWRLINSLPSLQTLEISHDDGRWNNVRHQRPDGTRPLYLPKIKEIYLHESIASPRALHFILMNAPDLKILYMTPRREPELYDADVEGWGDNHPESFDNALKLRPKQLTELDVAWYDCTGLECLIGPEGRLTSLPLLVNLDKLCIQFAVIYGTDPATRKQHLVDLLPPNISELNLVEWWWEDADLHDDMMHWNTREKNEHYHSKRDYRAMAVEILSSFAQDCREKMSNLRAVTFRTEFRYTWCLDGYVSAESHFDDVKELFARVGVEFKVDCEAEIVSLSVP